MASTSKKAVAPSRVEKPTPQRVPPALAQCSILPGRSQRPSSQRSPSTPALGLGLSSPTGSADRGLGLERGPQLVAKSKVKTRSFE
jgi:hypothetical protein